MTTIEAVIMGLLVGSNLAMAWGVGRAWRELHRMKVNR